MVHNSRHVYNVSEFNKYFGRVSEVKYLSAAIKNMLLSIRLKTFGFAFLPVLSSISLFYSWSKFLKDIISGITIGIFQIPQGMAYGILAGLKPINGLYTSFYPVLMYFIFGTSRHISFGTFSLASLLISQPIIRLSEAFKNGKITGIQILNNQQNSETDYMFRIQISIMITILVGICQVIMGVFQLGLLINLISPSLISGFTCATSFHILASQLANILGVNLPRVYGPGNLLIKLYNAAANITKANILTVSISVLSIVTLLIFRIFINPHVKRRFKLQIPSEILLTVVGTAVSHYSRYESKHKVKVVGIIPQGLPKPTMPSLQFSSEVISDVVIISIVTFVMSASIVKFYALKFDYDVMYNQECIANGVANIFGSFFQCHVACGSLARTSVAVDAGMTSQVATLVSSCLLLIVLFFISPLLYDLPYAILSAIILVALLGPMTQILELAKLWTQSKLDAATWILTFLATFVIDVTYGMMIGVGFLFITLAIQIQHCRHNLLGRVGDTDFYAELSIFRNVSEIAGIKIIRFDGPLCFLNCERFSEAVFKLSGLDPTIPVKAISKCNLNWFICLYSKVSNLSKSDNTSAGSNCVSEEIEMQSTIVNTESNHPTTRYIILDAYGWSYVDSSGLLKLKQVVKHYSEYNIQVLIAACRPSIYDFLSQMDVFPQSPDSHYYVTINDAVIAVESKYFEYHHIPDENYDEEKTFTKF